MFDGLDGTFRTIKLRGRQNKCPVCGDNPTITKLIDYEQFCGARASDKVGMIFNIEICTCVCWSFCGDSSLF